MDYRDIITIEPDKMGGKPCIRGMRITVDDVLSYLAAGTTHEQILADFPYLTEEDIRACLTYAAERKRQEAVVRFFEAADRLAALGEPLSNEEVEAEIAAVREARRSENREEHPK